MTRAKAAAKRSIERPRRGRGSTPRAAISCCHRPRRARTVWSRSARRGRRGLVCASAAARGLELGADRFARGDPFGARDVVTLRVAREEAIARAAEPLPDRLRPALLDRTDRLPLGLEPSDLGGGLVPVGRLGERLGLAHSASFFARFSAQTFFAIEVFVAPGEEPIAGGAEAVPDRLLPAARHRPDRLPLGLQLLDLLGGLNPARRLGERLRLLAQGGLLREVGAALFGLRGEVRFAARPDLVVRRLEAPPQRIGLRARHVGGLRHCCCSSRTSRAIASGSSTWRALPSSRRAVPGRRRSPSAASRRPRGAPAPSASAPPAPPSAAA